MSKITLFIILLLCLLIVIGRDCSAQPVSSVDLINNAKDYNGKTVVYGGEVVGDIMARGEYAWINVNDGKNAIGIWIKKRLVKDLAYTGRYQAKGDLVEVTGRFNCSCLEHGGDLDIHAQSILKINPGNKVSHPLSAKEINFALGLFLAVVLAFFLRIKAPRAKK